MVFSPANRRPARMNLAAMRGVVHPSWSASRHLAGMNPAESRCCIARSSSYSGFYGGFEDLRLHGICYPESMHSIEQQTQETQDNCQHAVELEPATPAVKRYQKL